MQMRQWQIALRRETELEKAGVSIKKAGGLDIGQETSLGCSCSQ